ncbi:MAG: hypothetical protein JWM10_4924 [Myxococcaceae bacterium]|nr:hypothetical protein [Myxococcaceae bacterium]
MPYRRSSTPPPPPADAPDLRAEDVVGVREAWPETDDPRAERVRIRALAVVTCATVVLGALVVLLDGR